MKPEEKKSVPIENWVWKEMAHEKTETGFDIYELVRFGWEAYKRNKLSGTVPDVGSVLQPVEHTGPKLLGEAKDNNDAAAEAGGHLAGTVDPTGELRVIVEQLIEGVGKLRDRSENTEAIVRGIAELLEKGTQQRPERPAKRSGN